MAIGLGVGCSGGTEPRQFGGGTTTTVDVAVVEGGVVECATPENREEAPYTLVDPGGDWGAQYGHGNPEANHVGGGLVVADLTGDGRLDILFPSNGGPQLFVGQADGSYLDESDERLPHGRPDKGIGGVAADHDGDGDLDLFLAGLLGASVLLENDGSGVFVDSSEALGLDDASRETFGGAWGDVDGDGDLDLFVAVHGYSGAVAHPQVPGALSPPQAPPELPTCFGNALLLNDGGGRYTDSSAQLSDAARHGCTFVGGFHDLDADGGQDLYVVNDFGPMVQPNAVMWGGQGVLVAGSQQALDVPVFGMGLGVGDLNGDPYPDVFVTGWDQVHLLESDGGADWIDTTAARGLRYDPTSTGHHVGWASEIVDIDNDGNNELHAVFGQMLVQDVLADYIDDVMGWGNTSQPDAVWTRDGDGIFQEVGEAWGLDADGVSRGVVWADLNDDGWLDLIRQDLMAPAEIHMAQCGSAGWLRVALSQPGPNPDAIGARITLTVDGVSRFADVRAGGTGFGSAGPPEVHFGLGAAATVERLEIAWPDGAKSTVEDLAGSQRVWIARGG